MKHLSLAGEWLYDANWGRGMVMLPAKLDGSFAGRSGGPLRERVVFTRTVSLPRRYAKRRAFFYLEQVGACLLRVNGEVAGRCIRRYLPWEIEITALLHPGDNEFVLELDSFQSPDGHNGCGKIELLLLPNICIRYFHTREGTVSVLPEGLSCGNVTVEIGNKSFYRSFVQPGWVDVPFETKRLKRWRPDFPRLYRMNCILTTPDWKEIKKESQVGLRSLSVHNNRFCVDGIPYYLIGREMSLPAPAAFAADCEWWAARFQLEKAHGVNLLLCSGWCPPENAFLAADQSGIFIAVLPPGPFQYGGDEFSCRTETQDLLFLYGSHPSFAMAAVDKKDESLLSVAPLQEKEDFLLQTLAGTLRLAAIPAPEDPAGWKMPVETALLRQDCGGILLRADSFPDEFPAAKGFSGLLYRTKNRPTLRQWRQFCSDLVLLLDRKERDFPCSGIFSARLLVRNCRKKIERCTLRWQAGEHTGTVSCSLPLGLHEVCQIDFSLPDEECHLVLSASFQETDCQNSWILHICPKHEKQE